MTVCRMDLRLEEDTVRIHLLLGKSASAREEAEENQKEQRPGCFHVES
jgi:hypothetical protein